MICSSVNRFFIAVPLWNGLYTVTVLNAGSRSGRYVERERNGKTAVGLLYAVKAGVGIGSTLALGLTMLSSSAPLFERIASSITGHKIRIAILNRIGQGIADATARKVAIAIGEKVIAIAAERAGAMVVGRVLLFMASWEIQVAAIAIRVVI
ncbi:hypothetical protein [Burkholderia pseudomallei]|uniref:hypothetical protein n=1 Tax=Burkholderia pseudomallei TaxID=28450 RepID=UPI001F504C5C|nr:hypothetical protein [Burkholderia pseudomallei]